MVAKGRTVGAREGSMKFHKRLEYPHIPKNTFPKVCDYDTPAPWDIYSEGILKSPDS